MFRRMLINSFVLKEWELHLQRKLQAFILYYLIITSTKEVVFLSVFVCLSVFK